MQQHHLSLFSSPPPPPPPPTHYSLTHMDKESDLLLPYSVLFLLSQYPSFCLMAHISLEPHAKVNLVMYFLCKKKIPQSCGNMEENTAWKMTTHSSFFPPFSCVMGLRLGDYKNCYIVFTFSSGWEIKICFSPVLVVQTYWPFQRQARLLVTCFNKTCSYSSLGFIVYLALLTGIFAGNFLLTLIPSCFLCALSGFWFLYL